MAVPAASLPAWTGRDRAAIPIVSPRFSRGGRMKVAGSMPDCRAPAAIVVIARTRDQRPETRNLSQVAPSGPISRIPFRRKRSRSFLWSRGYPRARAADPEADPLSGEAGRAPAASLFGLAPHGVYRAPA